MILAASAGAEIVDRIAVTVGNVVITELDVRRQHAAVALLNLEPARFTGPPLRETAVRMADQVLILNEMKLSRYSMPGPAEAEKSMARVIEEDFRGRPAFEAALKEYGLREADIRDLLLKQLAVVRFIELRFAPGVQFSEQDVREYYEKEFVPALRKKSQPVPAFPEVREQITRILMVERAGRALDEWLAEARKAGEIEIRENVFQ
jgi:hypothetical protein